MVRSGSLFSQLLEQIPRSAFAKLVNRHGAEYCAKGGVKAYVLLDHDHYMPSYVLISKAKLHDSKLLARLRLNPGSIIAMDRAYNDYAQFGQWTEQRRLFRHPHERQRPL